MRPASVAASAASLAVLVGLGDHPYGYYQFLRLLLAGISLFLWFGAHFKLEDSHRWLLGGTAVLYNPIVPVEIGDKDIWSVLNIVTVIGFWFVCLKGHSHLTALEPVRPSPRIGRERGEISQLMLDKGSGFIRSAYGEVWFHRSEVRDAEFELLKEGQPVQFQRGDGYQDSSKATDIRLV